MERFKKFKEYYCLDVDRLSILKSAQEKYIHPILVTVIISLLLSLNPVSGGVQQFVSEEPGLPGQNNEESEDYFLTFKDGFKYLHLEGSPQEIGYLHGSLLADYVQRSLEGYAHATELWQGMDWEAAWPCVTAHWQTG